MAEPRDRVDQVAADAPLVLKSAAAAADRFAVFPDSVKLFFGSDGDASFVFDGTNAVLAVAAGAGHVNINSGVTASDVAGKTVKINSITNTGTANSLIGFQSKPAQGASTAQNVIGGEISPRLNSTFALTGSGTIIGLHVDAYLKGTTGDVAGSVRGQQIELVTDDAGARTITGDVVGLRFRAAFSATAITGDMVPILIEKAETQTNSQQWDHLLKVSDEIANVAAKHGGAGAALPADVGYLRVKVKDTEYKIALYNV